MGNNQYTDLWENYRPVIINLVKNGGGHFPLDKDKFVQRGNRDKYAFSLTVVNGNIPTNSSSAVARDLKTVLDKSDSFKKYSVGKIIRIRLTPSYSLEVTLL